MKKKTYMTPCTTEDVMAPMEMIAFSGGGDGVAVSGDEDQSNGPNRSRHSWHDVWEEDN